MTDMINEAYGNTIQSNQRSNIVKQLIKEAYAGI